MLPKYHKNQGHDVEIIASLESFDEHGQGVYLPNASKYKNEYQIPVTRLDYSNTPFSKVFRKYVGLKKELERVSPDLIFIHGVQFADISVVVSYLKTHRKTIVYIDNHSDFSNSATNWLSKKVLHEIIWRHYAQLINPYVKKFYGVLPARVDFLINEYRLPQEKVELLVMGADDERVANAARPETRKMIREQYHLSENDFVVMTGGKIDAFKMQTLLLMEAVRQIDNPRIKLIVFGSITQDLEEKVKKLADGKKIQFIGWIKASESYNYFAASDLVVFPGRHSVFWEQVVAQGIPMICKKWAGTCHVDIGGNVLFVDEDSVDTIKEKITLLLNNKDAYYRMQRIARENGMKYFSYNEIARRSIEN